MTEQISSEKINLKALSAERVVSVFNDMGLPRYRANQLLHWIYQKYASRIQEITEFSHDLRKALDEKFFMSNLVLLKRLKSSDNAEKFLFSLSDSQTIESVLIPEGDRVTLCVSSQVGCAMNCSFCLTGSMGFVRNLESYEITDQILAVNRLISPRRITHIVLMGMGEPLANFEQVVDALWRITRFLHISKRRITLSTAGLASRLSLLPEKAPEVNLAISLNATTDESRNLIMPINKRYPLSSLIAACRDFPLKPRRRITFEYVLIEGVNDSDEDARRLARLTRGLRCKINLIPLNPHSGSKLKRPSESRILDFQKILIQNNLTALIRESRGQDILAACGQLKSES